MIRLTINGEQIETQEGNTLLDAALEHGIRIPTLCYLGEVAPIGSCRLCLVEVEGLEKPVTSCTTPAVEGLVVKTESPRLTELRTNALQLMLINHPLDCPVCDKAGECALQDLTYEMGVASQPFEIEKAPAKIDILSPLIERYESRCIRCGRCVSVCHEVQGCGAYRFKDTGYGMVIDTLTGGPLDCDFCGLCIAACPVGALINKLFKYRARTWELEKVATICPYCGAGCRINLNVKEDLVYRVTPVEETATSCSSLCSRGTFGFGFVNNKDRLHTPLIRKNIPAGSSPPLGERSGKGPLVPVSWEEALDYVAQRLKAIQEKNGADAIAGIGSVRVTNEENYLFQKLLRQGLGTNNIDSYARAGYVQAIEALQAGLGVTRSTVDVADIEDADCLFIIGTDFAVEMPVPSLRVIRAAREGRAKLINALPRGSKLDRFAHLRLRYKPGTEVALAMGLAKVIVSEGGKQGKGFPKGFDDFKKSLQQVSLEEISSLTGVSAEEITEAARTLAAAGKACIIFGYDLITQESGKDGVSALVNLALLTGTAGCGLYLATEKNNLRGAVEMGVTPHWLPGFTPLSSAPGKTISRMMDAMTKGELKALYVMGANPLAELPYGGRLQEAMSRLEFLVVQDIFSTELMEIADCVLPAATFAEKDGTFTNSDGKVQQIRKAIACYKNARPDWEIITGIGRRLGLSMAYKNAGEITREIKESVPGFGTPLPAVSLSPSGERRFVPVALPVKKEDKQYPFTLTVGPMLFHCGTLSTHAEGLNILASEPWLDISPEDLTRLSLNSGDAVKVTSAQGSVQVETKANPNLPCGTLFMPLHFAGAKAARLTLNSSLVRVKLERC